MGCIREVSWKSQSPNFQLSISFDSLAGEYGLKLLYHATFHELFEAHREDPEFSKLLERMKVVTPEGESELTEEQWEAASE